MAPRTGPSPSSPSCSSITMDGLFDLLDRTCTFLELVFFVFLFVHIIILLILINFKICSRNRSLLEEEKIGRKIIEDRLEERGGKEKAGEMIQPCG